MLCLTSQSVIISWPVDQYNRVPYFLPRSIYISCKADICLTRSFLLILVKSWGVRQRVDGSTSDDIAERRCGERESLGWRGPLGGLTYIGTSSPLGGFSRVGLDLRCWHSQTLDDLDQGTVDICKLKGSENIPRVKKRRKCCELQGTSFSSLGPRREIGETMGWICQHQNLAFVGWVC